MTQDLGNLAWSGFSFRLEHEGQLGSARLGLTASPHGRATSRHFTPNRRQEWAIVDEDLRDRPRPRTGGFDRFQRTTRPAQSSSDDDWSGMPGVDNDDDVFR